MVRIMILLKPSLLLLCIFPLITCKGLHEEFSWTRINYVWPGQDSSSHIDIPKPDPIAFPGSTNSNERHTTRRPGRTTRRTTQRPDTNSDYIYENNIPMGANLWKDKLFITVPRRRMGVPSTVNFVWANSSERHNVPLIPYPDWKTNTLRDSRDSNRDDGYRFVSVYRVAVDLCDRLWFVDTGLIETPGNPQQIQPTALVIMDLKTDKVLQYYQFPANLLRNTSNLASLTIDMTNNNCRDAFAYIPDVGGYGLVVYSLSQNKAWRVNHNYFYLENTVGEFSIGGHEFQWNDGIFSIAITDVKSDGFRDAYFHSMAGVNLYKVSTRILKNEELATRSYHGSDFKIVGNKGELSQTSSSDLHQSKGVLFLGLVNQNALGCWNINKPLSDISLVQRSDEKMIYPSDVKIVEDKIVVLTNTMPVFLYGTLDYDRTNFRVWVETVDTAIRGTKCESSRGGSHY
ncbi:L-dopachrome tautomerase yellow-f2-like [Tribolium madens]|uniref:L-dopachrome tautomerase yellow-f2-like n=1 Tax=Tribolium madens TaxID=41895 RepID=UPI001CF75E89|nr:L-dopachrome tautomerase yellow-f2-like [Tribolium madens]